MLLLVSVWVSLVPTTAPLGAATVVAVLRAVRTTIPFDPGSLITAVPELNWAQLFVAGQPYRFAPEGALVLKKSSPGEQVAGRVVPVFTGLVQSALVKSTFRPCVLRLIRVVCPLEARTSAAEISPMRDAVRKQS
jgi:hypothetical protein